MNRRRPLIMVAPNGARRTRADHPALPVTISQIVETAKVCRTAGADAIHAHVRDSEERHVLDTGLYGELISEMERHVPSFPVQITTEAAGRYSPAEQYAMLDVPGVAAISAALREIGSDPDETARRRFYWKARERGISLQHILYDPEEIAAIADAQKRGIIPPEPPDMLFVLGSYQDRIAKPADLGPFLCALRTADMPDGTRFMIAAFGQHEIACLTAGAREGGDCRIGFENNLLHPDGSLLQDNADSVAALTMALSRDDSGVAENDLK